MAYVEVDIDIDEYLSDASSSAMKKELEERKVEYPQFDTIKSKQNAIIALSDGAASSKSAMNLERAQKLIDLMRDPDFWWDKEIDIKL